ncbi:MAG TPA: 2-amino-4-hydroxy-6-hydroxymethyldihydropteridine diphosphokinase [Stellaceae bacterium]|nr:2-amino-4-hydroxy-6-hydroxymethyldihydropteridine diphosphokinase [Stellaceae bacterium]
MDTLILIGLGGNLPSARYGEPRHTLEATIKLLVQAGLGLRARSRWYVTAPVPISDQPWYLNGVVSVTTDRDPAALLTLLHDIEASIGRVRGIRNAPRAIDLDLLAYGDRVAPAPAWPILPHPRLHERAFVLRPLADIAPMWRHPQNGLGIEDMLRTVDPAQHTRLMSPDELADKLADEPPDPLG